MRTRFGMRAKTAAHRMVAVAVFSVLAVAFAFPVQVFAAKAAGPQAPTVYSPADGVATASHHPLITGVTVNNTRVAVLLDDEFHGFATVVDDESGTAHFAYTPTLALKSGQHTLRVRAESRETSHWGGTSEATTFVVEYDVPTPALLDTVVTPTKEEQPMIRGLAHAQTVKVYIDGEFDGEAEVKDAREGVGHFAYTPSSSLEAGKKHEVVATAVNTNGRESVASSVLSIVVPTAQAAAVAGVTDTSVAVAEETSDEAPASTTPAEEETAPSAEVTSSTSDETEASGESSDEDSSDEATDDSDDEEADENEDDSEVNRSVVTWVIVLAVLVILAVLRFRGSGKDGGASGGASFRMNDKGSSGGGSFSGGSKPENKSDSMPNPPPPSSNY